MKRITFFNEKGGTGKTTFNALFASWLAYEKGKRVFVQDFDYPNYQLLNIRKNEVDLMARDPRFASLVTATPYPIGKVSGNGVYSREQLAEIVAQVREYSAGEGYCVLDFPGRFLAEDPARAIAASGLLDLVVFPVDSDRQSISSALFVSSLMRNPRFLARAGKERQELLVMWNRETRSERRGKRDPFADGDETFRLLGIPVCATRAREILSLRRDGEVFGFMRSTVCYPRTNIRMYAPWMEDLFEEILARLDGTYSAPAVEEKAEEGQ